MSKTPLSLMPFITFLFVFACHGTSSRRLLPDDLLQRRDRYLAQYESELQRASEGSRERMRREYHQAQRPGAIQSQSYDMLVLSGGGEFGAFGAGFLEGWGQVEEPEYRRPQFDIVSGVSTGALIAPFAFVGTSSSYERIVELYENPDPDWVQERGILSFLLGDDSYFDVTLLHQEIRSTISHQLISAIAEGSEAGRQLLIGATNIDFGMMRVWDIARMAQEIDPKPAREKVVSILLASSAIPAAFPPVTIDDFLYVDGGAAMQVVGGTGDRDWLEANLDPSWELEPGAKPIRLRIWVVMNQKLLPDPEVVDPTWSNVAVRGLDTLIRTSALQSLQDTETYVRFIDQREEFNAVMRYVSIPQDFSILETDDMFDPEKMKALVELGRQMGQNPGSWKTKALRPGAPFVGRSKP